MYNEFKDLKTTKIFRKVIKVIVKCDVNSFSKLLVVHFLSDYVSKNRSLLTFLDFEINTALASFMYAVLKNDQDFS